VFFISTASLLPWNARRLDNLFPARGFFRHGFAIGGARPGKERSREAQLWFRRRPGWKLIAEVIDVMK
jgi:hypothetical protein